MSATPARPSAISQNCYTTATSTEIGLTATASGTQATSYLLSAQMTVFATVTTGNDGCLLPKITAHQPGDSNPGQVGMIMIIRNDSASNAMQVFPSVLDTINLVTSATGVSIPAAKTAMFIADRYTQSSNVGNWSMLLSA